MTAKPFFPMHDDTGALWPELDWRWVTGSVICQYDRISHYTLHHRSLHQWYGATGSTLVRWRMLPDGRQSRIHEFCPAAIWRAKRMGRYSDPTFDPRQVAKRIYDCDPAKTAARQIQQQTANLPADVMSALGHQAGALRQALALIGQIAPQLLVTPPSAEPIAFPGGR